LYNEILRSEIIKWWSDERASISEDLTERLPHLLDTIDKIIKDMNITNLSYFYQLTRTPF
jgi:hypothetical protein